MFMIRSILYLTLICLTSAVFADDWFSQGIKKPQGHVDELVPRGSGTGFAVSEHGYIVTNHHVVDVCDAVYALFDGGDEAYPLRLVALDAQNDLAVLQSDFTPPSVLPIRSQKADLLEEIYVVGYPNPQLQGDSIKTTRGVVSSVNGFRDDPTNLQVDAAIYGGNSGGPIMDTDGNVVAITVATVRNQENVGYGIKPYLLTALLNKQGIRTFSEEQSGVTRSELTRRIRGAVYKLGCYVKANRLKKKSNSTLK